MSGAQEEPPEGIDFEEIFRDSLNKAGFPEFPEGGSWNEAAVAQHEIYTVYRTVGFTTGQALYMTAVALTGSPGSPPIVSDQEDL